MVERYPWPGGGVLAAGGDAVAVEDGEPRLYLLLDGERGFPVNDMVEAGRVWLHRAALPVAGWLEGPPLVEARAARSVDEYAEWLASRLRGLAGRRVLLGYSGGKDSTAALLVLEELQEYIDLKYRAVYIHVPFLEPEANIRFVEHVARRTGAPIEVVEAGRHWMKSMLRWRGLPSRGDRWCTVAKVKPMRRMLKADRGLVEAVADRPGEAPKRLRRLWYQLTRLEPLAGRRLRPILWLTLGDVIGFVRSAGLIHPDYLRGMHRVACLICPYRPLNEIPEDWDSMLPDPGVVEEAARRRWRREVRGGRIPFSLYMEQHLWRYPGDTAVKLARVRLDIESSCPASGAVWPAGEAARQAARWAWLSGWSSSLPLIGPERVAELTASHPQGASRVSPSGWSGPSAPAWARSMRRRGPTGTGHGRPYCRARGPVR